MSAYEFKNKVVVITGASSGIGRALAENLASKGARLALSDERNTQELVALGRRLSAKCECRTYAVDVSDREVVFAHAAQVKQDFGRADCVINNAGVTVIGTIAHMSIEEIEWQLSINLWGVIYGTKAFLPIFLEQREGRIVNISSVFGLVSFPTQGAYNISKFGVRGLTECLWSELDGTGVEAVVVHPGGIKTNIEAQGRRCRAAGNEEAGFSSQAATMLTTPPEVCATDIVRGVERGRKRIITGNKSTSLYWLSRLLPNHYPAIVKRLAN
ncbi:SDR family NAD(P)-dependent oxidoreductase [Sinimarinibacterium sp. CAU 1509]|uniref:SDR family NAD(P)-dependent oxidoreductase n=1 Tax=Sinimarinibacterium sp. CAU 1509 TaxID=2562283 RepID=UPI0010AB5B40|nr:SDR family NAD(P)-dependent oxidoreductase [Sinimarinibacterium sp. CAU 1509]TJY58391.1 SDR family NAD(P)-dependent oxidoreductase [Sinimarinibacterium sp. CAU 1509]